MSPEATVSLSGMDVARLMEALDAYEYWQLGDVLPRNNGMVFIPGDLEPGRDRYWDGEPITSEQREAIDEIVACRSLSERLLQRAQEAGLG
jgi:hypothetical protein